MLVTAMSFDDFFNFCATMATTISSAVTGTSGFFFEDRAAFVLAGAGDGFAASELLGSEEYGGGESFVTLLLPEDGSAEAGCGSTS